MAPETLTSSAEETALVDAVAQGVAKEARTAQDFQRGFEGRVRTILGTDGAQSLSPTLARQFEDRRTLIKQALRQAGDAKLEDHEPGVGGTNTLQGGTDNMTLNRANVAAVKDEKSAEKVETDVAHENGHGEAVPLTGDLLPRFRGQVHGDIQELMQEGFAEVRANEKMGKSLDFRRPGQPDKVYGEGHDLVLKLARKTSWQDVKRLMTGHGDLYQFQAEALK